MTTDGSGVLTWETPSGGSDGNGIYDGSDTIPTNTTATLTDWVQFGTGLRIDDNGLLLGTTTNVSGYNLVSQGPIRTNAGHLYSRGSGVPSSSTAAAAVRLYNTSGFETLDIGVEDDDEIYVGTGNAGEVLHVNTDGTVQIPYSEVSDPTPDSDHFYSGKLTIHTANENQAIGDAVYIDSDGEAHIADASSVSTAGVLFMAAATITAASTGYYIQPGSYIRDDTWNWTPGGAVYLTITGTTGNTLSQTAPSGTGEAVVIVGRATTADILYFYPQVVTVEID